jgi:preprotein translocase subunit SecG
MNSLYTLMVVIQVIMALLIMGLVLVQHGKGADMGAAFGSGASGSLFGATGSSSFLSKATAVAATLFFCATLALAYLGNAHTAPSAGVMKTLGAPPAEAPAANKASEIPPVTGTTTDQSTQPAQPASTPASSQADQIPK